MMHEDKYCTQCGEYLETKYFHENVDSEDGYSKFCKICTKINQNREDGIKEGPSKVYGSWELTEHGSLLYERSKEIVTEAYEHGPEFRPCHICEETYLLSHFHCNDHTEYDCICKVCARETIDKQEGEPLDADDYYELHEKQCMEALERSRMIRQTNLMEIASSLRAWAEEQLDSEEYLDEGKKELFERMEKP